MKWLMSLVVVVMLGCSSSQSTSTPQPAPPSKQVYVLEKLGYKNIQLSTADPWACSEDDSWLNSSSFTATGPNGPISGTVCCGWLKGCTVRY